MRPVRKANNCRGQALLESLLATALVAPAVTLFLALTFHLTGWAWSHYWSYQSLHCVFEKSQVPRTCLQALRSRFEFHPGEKTAQAHILNLEGSRATLKWSYHLNFVLRSWKVEKTWTLKRPQPAKRIRDLP